MPNAVATATLHSAAPDAAAAFRRAHLRATVLPQTIMSKVKVLFFAADPLSTNGTRNPLQLAQEARDIEHNVNAAIHRDAMEFRSHWATRTRDLGPALRRFQPQVVHFSGHGGSEGLVLEGDGPLGVRRVTAGGLRKFFEAYREGIRVVVLNACHSQPQAQAIADAVGCAIGTPSQISDADAITFSTAFYSSIADGRSVQVAFDQACAELDLNACPEDEIPKLVVGRDVNASQLFLIPPPVSSAEQPDSGPAAHEINILPPPKPKLWKAVGWTALGATVLAVAVPPLVLEPIRCAPARAVQRMAMASSASAQARLAPIKSAGSDSVPDPMAGPPELVQARALHDAGNHTEDFALLSQAAETGHPDAMTALGLAFLKGDGTAVDEGSAIAWLRKAAYEGDRRAMTELAKAYLNRQGVSRDSDRHAKGWLDKAAAKGYPEAMLLLGNLYRDGRGMDEADGAMALHWYTEAAKGGIVDAMVDAGLMYEDGLVVPRNEKVAMCWYRAAADAGSIRGNTAIGVVDERLNKSHDVDD